jgi:endonuclease YncB( thermonuclease family)
VYANLHGAIGLRKARFDKTQRALLAQIAGTPPVAARPDGMPPPRRARTARAARISDGDTFQLDDGRWVRLMGLDAPDADQPGGTAATKALRRMIPRGTELRLLVGDPGTENRPTNPPGRTRAYVWRADGTFLNSELVADGDARRRPEPDDGREATGAYGRALDAAQAHARDLGSGIWSTCQRHARD